MKKFIAVLLLAACVNFSYASFTTTSAEPVTQTIEQVQRAQEKMLMEKISTMSVKEYESLTGKKLNLVEKVTFKLIKHQFKKKLADAETSGFNIGGFLLGLILGLIGVLGAYIFSHDSNFRKWTWIGWGVWVAIVLITVAL